MNPQRVFRLIAVVAPLTLLVTACGPDRTPPGASPAREESAASAPARTVEADPDIPDAPAPEEVPLVSSPGDPAVAMPGDHGTP